MSDNRAVQRFFAHLLMTVGGLITVLCGGCTVLFLGAVFVLGLLSASGAAGMAKGTVLMEILATALLTGGYLPRSAWRCSSSGRQ
jgi:hypothetical protein